MSVSGYVLGGAVELFYLRAYVEHSPNDGVEPPTKAELIEKAHRTALSKYPDPQALFQVSPWTDVVSCEPVFRGSPRCYQGTVFSKATFVRKDEINAPRQVRVSGKSMAYDSPEGKCIERDWANARMKAEHEAEFACNDAIIKTPINVEQRSEQHLDTWYDQSTYVATFNCEGK